MTYISLVEAGSTLPPRQACPTVLMVRPLDFGYNKETAISNPYQTDIQGLGSEELCQQALEEFDAYVDMLRQNKIHVHVIDSPSKHCTPDAVFPNNWFSCHPCGTVITYPMLAENRRHERRQDILKLLCDKHNVKQLVDLSYYEKEGRYLEGTGSLVLDYKNRKAYAALSPRTDKDLVLQVCDYLGYEPVIFKARDRFGLQVYHTNIMLFVGTDVAVLCSDAIRNPSEREKVKHSLKKSGHRLIEISMDQMEAFCGNILEVANSDGERFIVMSNRAYNAFTSAQKRTLQRSSTLISSDLNTIETVGGGGARCMLAGIFLSVAEN